MLGHFKSWTLHSRLVDLLISNESFNSSALLMVTPSSFQPSVHQTFGGHHIASSIWPMLDLPNSGGSPHQL